MTTSVSLLRTYIVNTADGERELPSPNGVAAVDSLRAGDDRLGVRATSHGGKSIRPVDMYIVQLISASSVVGKSVLVDTPLCTMHSPADYAVAKITVRHGTALSRHKYVCVCVYIPCAELT